MRLNTFQYFKSNVKSVLCSTSANKKLKLQSSYAACRIFLVVLKVEKCSALQHKA